METKPEPKGGHVLSLTDGVPEHTWWHRKKDKGTYYIGQVAFGWVWLVKLYAKTSIKITTEAFKKEMELKTFIQFNEDGTLQE